MSLQRRTLLGLAAGAILSAPTFTFSSEDPPSLAGTWTWTWKDAKGDTHRHVLELEGTGAKMTGKERADDKPAVKVESLKQEGKTISFAVNRDGLYAEYKGTVASTDVINGLVTVMQGGATNEYGWTATRKPTAK
jgi:outer membrane lipopolysaccharide assembly protein LptE/RlpB